MTYPIMNRDPALMGTMTTGQKTALYIVGGTVTGLVLFMLVRSMRKRRARKGK